MINSGIFYGQSKCKCKKSRVCISLFMKQVRLMFLFTFRVLNKNFKIKTK